MSQIMPIKQTYACVLVALRNIEAGESLTVLYTAQGYHEADSTCGCASCNPLNPPNAPRHEVPLCPMGGKRPRRGGRRGNAKKRKAEAGV